MLHATNPCVRVGQLSGPTQRTISIQTVFQAKKNPSPSSPVVQVEPSRNPISGPTPLVSFWSLSSTPDGPAHARAITARVEAGVVIRVAVREPGQSMQRHASVAGDSVSLRVDGEGFTAGEEVVAVFVQERYEQVVLGA